MHPILDQHPPDFFLCLVIVWCCVVTQASPSMSHRAHQNAVPLLPLKALHCGDQDLINEDEPQNPLDDAVLVNPGLNLK